MIARLALACAVALALVGSTAHADDGEQDPLAPYEDALKKLGRLRGKERTELLEKLDAALAATDAPQVKLVAGVVGASKIDPDDLDAASEYEPHDAKRWVDAKRDRKLQRSSSSRWKQLHERIHATVYPPRELETRAIYEWSTGRVVADPAHADDDELLFRNLLRGFPPQQDVAEALVQQALDGARPLSKEAEFFAHPYADLDGRWYERISLYDVWSHQIPNDVPDVEARAFASLVRGESAPNPLSRADQQTWYPRMQEAAKKLLRHRRSAEAVAAVWFQGAPKLQHGYANTASYLQALVAREKEQLEPVRARFVADSIGFLDVAKAEADADGGKGYEAGNARAAALEAGRAKIHAAVVGVLRAEGYLDD